MDHPPRNRPAGRAEATRAAPPERARRRHDQTYKRLFAHAAALRSPVRHFAACGWVRWLALPSLHLFPTESVGRGLARRLCDCICRVRFKDGRRSAVFLFEFQSTVDPRMSQRTLGYAEAVRDALLDNENLLDPGGVMPLLLPCVVYTGARPWTGGTDLEGLAATPPRLPTAVVRATAGWGTAHAYRRLDLQAFKAQDLGEDPLIGWLATLERDGWKAFPAVHRSMAAHWGGPEHLAVRAAFADWTVERLRALGVPEDRREEARAQIIQPKEEEDMAQTYQEWVEEHTQKGVAQGLAQGLAQGREEGREAGRTMVLRQVSRKFGVETAARLEGLVRSMGAEQLAVLGDAVVDCDTGDALLAAANGSPRRP